MRRVLCVWLPRWPIQRLVHARPEFHEKAVVVFAESGRGLHIVSCSTVADQWGIRPGMPLAEARGLCGSSTVLIAEPFDPKADRQALTELAWLCQSYSPLIGLEEAEHPESLLLDITGCGVHFGGEEGLARALQDELSSYPYQALIAVADTVGAAWAMAHCGVSSTPHPLVIPTGQHVSQLRPLSITGLRLPLRIVETLHKLDIRKIGQLEKLPRETLPARFGKELQKRLDQAWGTTPELITPERIQEALFAVWNSQEAGAHREAWEFITQELLDQILAKLLPLRLGIRELEGRFTGTGKSLALRLRLLQPSVDRRHLWDLLRLEWERQERMAQTGAGFESGYFHDGVTSIRLEVSAAARLRVRQQTLFDEEPGQKEAQAFQQLVERLGSRLGEAAVLRSRIVPDPLPEMAYEFATWEGTPNNMTALPFSPWDALVSRSRPLRLLQQPESIQVLAAVPDGPPHRIDRQNGQLVVSRAFGPERIATGWWRGDDVQRDYYRVETDQGERLWIFRCLCTGQWFLHGSYE